MVARTSIPCALLAAQCVCGSLLAGGPRAEVVGEGKVDFGRYPARERKEAARQRFQLGTSLQNCFVTSVFSRYGIT